MCKNFCALYLCIFKAAIAPETFPLVVSIATSAREKTVSPRPARKPCIKARVRDFFLNLFSATT